MPTLCGGAQRDFLVRLLGLKAEGNAPVKIFSRYGFDGTFGKGSLPDIDLLVPEAFLACDLVPTNSRCETQSDLLLMRASPLTSYLSPLQPVPVRA